MIESLPAAATIGEISRRLGQPVHRVEWIIRARNVRPVQRAGNCRIFSQEDVDYIAAELRRIDREMNSL